MQLFRTLTVPSKTWQRKPQIRLIAVHDTFQCHSLTNFMTQIRITIAGVAVQN